MFVRVWQSRTWLKSEYLDHHCPVRHRAIKRKTRRRKVNVSVVQHVEGVSVTAEIENGKNSAGVEGHFTHPALSYRATTFSAARFSYSSSTRTAIVCSPGAASRVSK